MHDDDDDDFDSLFQSDAFSVSSNLWSAYFYHCFGGEISELSR